MSNDEVQKDLLVEMKTPDQALEYAMRREKGLENQLLIQKQVSTATTQMTIMKTESVGFIQRRGNNKNRYPTRGERRGRQPQQRRGNPQRKSTEQNECFKCGNLFGPAKDKLCNKWTKRGPYALLCKSSDCNVQDEQKFELSLRTQT